jgi:hypothetical protein
MKRKMRASQPHLRGTGRDSATSARRTGPDLPVATNTFNSGEAAQ